MVIREPARPRLRLGAAAVAAIVIVAGPALLAGCSGGRSSTGTRPLDAGFERLDGGQSSFTAFRGRPAVVNFFSSTCVPCQTEMPSFQKLHIDLGDRVAFVGLDVQDTVAAGRSFVEAVGVTWDLGRDPDARILQSLGGVGLPTTVILDRDGRVVFTHLGALPADQLRGELHRRGFA